MSKLQPLVDILRLPAMLELAGWGANAGSAFSCASARCASQKKQTFGTVKADGISKGVQTVKACIN